MKSSLINMSLGDVMTYADRKHLPYDTVRILEVFPMLGRRDTSRGGGPLTDEDIDMLGELPADDYTLAECVESAKEILPPGRLLTHSTIGVYEDENSIALIVGYTIDSPN